MADHYRHAISSGSVGKPKYGNPQGGYVMVTINDNSSIADEESIQVEFIRFNYHLETAAKGVEDSPLHDEYADMQIRGYSFQTTICCIKV